MGCIHARLAVVNRGRVGNCVNMTVQSHCSVTVLIMTTRTVEVHSHLLPFDLLSITSASTPARRRGSGLAASANAQNRPATLCTDVSRVIGRGNKRGSARPDGSVHCFGRHWATFQFAGPYCNKEYVLYSTRHHLGACANVRGVDCM